MKWMIEPHDWSEKMSRLGRTFHGPRRVEERAVSAASCYSMTSRPQTSEDHVLQPDVLCGKVKSRLIHFEYNGRGADAFLYLKRINFQNIKKF